MFNTQTILQLKTLQIHCKKQRKQSIPQTRGRHLANMISQIHCKTHIKSMPHHRQSKAPTYRHNKQTMQITAKVSAHLRFPREDAPQPLDPET